MSAALPTAFRFDDGVMVPTHPRLAAARFDDGETYLLVPHEDRSAKSHDQEFAWLHEVFVSFPEELAQRFPTPDHLRRHALIRTGWCTVTEYVCATKAEAERWRPILAARDEYSLVTVNGCVITELKAKSQSKKAMNKADWQASKTAIMEFIAGLIGVEVGQLPDRRAA